MCSHGRAGRCALPAMLPNTYSLTLRDQIYILKTVCCHVLICQRRTRFGVCSKFSVLGRADEGLFLLLKPPHFSFISSSPTFIHQTDGVSPPPVFSQPPSSLSSPQHFYSPFGSVPSRPPAPPWGQCNSLSVTYDAQASSSVS